MPIGKPSTFVKSFFAESVQAAMEHARVELGTDALLLDSREAPPEARHLGDFEVVFAASSGLSAARPAPQPVPAAAPRTESVEGLRRQVEEIRELMGRIAAAAPPSQEEKVAQALMEAGMEAGLAREIADAARQRVARRTVACIGAPRAVASAADPNLLLEAAEEVFAHIAVAPEIGRITALIGPPGSGKTTTLIKLAITQGLARGRAVRLISTDTQRIGGAEQLRTYAAILGVSFQAVETAAALEQAIELAPASALVLIDTAGYSAATLTDLGGDIARFLGGRQDIDTHLILTASMRLENLYRVAALYDPFGPSKLLFTRVDEASSLAAVFCLAARRNMPVSFLCGGQAIPEDLEPATKEKIGAALVRQLPTALEAAA